MPIVRLVVCSFGSLLRHVPTFNNRVLLLLARDGGKSLRRFDQTASNLLNNVLK